MAKGTTRDIKAFLGEETHFEGKLFFEGTVRIDGKFQGGIHTEDTIIIGETAIVDAEIEAGEVILSGTIHGNVYTRDNMEILAPGKMYGSIMTPRLAIQEGVIFEGTCRMEQLETSVNSKVSVLNQEGLSKSQDKTGE
jgi:cytoskeletal protein CcmA (bactofilin family)